MPERGPPGWRQSAPRTASHHGTRRSRCAGRRPGPRRRRGGSRRRRRRARRRSTWPVAFTKAANCALVTTFASMRYDARRTGRTGGSPSAAVRRRPWLSPIQNVLARESRTWPRVATGRRPAPPGGPRGWCRARRSRPSGCSRRRRAAPPSLPRRPAGGAAARLSGRRGSVTRSAAKYSRSARVSLSSARTGRRPQGPVGSVCTPASRVWPVQPAPAREGSPSRRMAATDAIERLLSALDPEQRQVAETLRAAGAGAGGAGTGKTRADGAAGSRTACSHGGRRARPRCWR